MSQRIKDEFIVVYYRAEGEAFLLVSPAACCEATNFHKRPCEIKEPAPMGLPPKAGLIWDKYGILLSERQLIIPQLPQRQHLQLQRLHLQHLLQLHLPVRDQRMKCFRVHFLHYRNICKLQ